MRSSILRRRLLRGALVAGGLLDLSLAMLLVVPSPLGAGDPPPVPSFYLRSGAVLLATLGAAGLLAASEPPRLGPLIPILALQRLALAGPLGQAAVESPVRPQAAFGALADIELALAIALLWGRIRQRR